MSPLRFALVDDEPPARLRLKRMVEALRPEAVCMAEAEDGEAACHLLKMTRPDVLFLDIEFPPAGAFGLLRRAKEEGLPLPPVVFVTAFDRHAVEAFRWEAWDFLLKPVDQDRLRESIQRVEQRLQARPDPGALLAALDAVRRAQAPERFTVLVKGRLRVLAWKEVTHLATENRLLFVYTSEGRFVLDRTLDELEELLTPRFFRCHRGAMAAFDAVKELIPEPGGTGELRLVGEVRLPVSRDRMAELRRRLG